MVKSTTKSNKMTRGSHQQTTQIVRLPRWGLPPQLGVTLKVSSLYNVSSAGSLIAHAISCNNPFQPFVTTTTSEVPAYLTYLSLAYQQLYVERANVRIEVVNSTVPDSVSTVLAIDGTPGGGHTMNTLAESLDSQARVIGYYTAGNNRAVLQHQFTPQRYLSIPPNSADNMCTGGPPIDEYFWILGMQPISAGSGNIGVRIVVEYDVVLTEFVTPSP